MSLLFEVVFASVARSTHHKLALDALTHLRGPDAVHWADVLLFHHQAYLSGAKAPDDQFKDFQNHVLHVRENYWGGAVNAARKWYATTVDHLRGARWGEAAYAAGVLSHYFSDPCMPLHTGQSEAEGAVHRAAEWSVTKSYEILTDLLEFELGGYPTLEVPAGEDWLGDLIRQGARLANPFYDLLIDHYNLEVGVKDPPRGLDRASQEALARCLGQAIVGWARVLDRAIEESGASPPTVALTLPAVLAAVRVPIRVVTSKLADAQDRRVVGAIYQEVQATGKAIESLPADDRLVRERHAAEVLRVPLSKLDAERPRAPGQKHGQPAASATPPRAEIRSERVRPTSGAPAPKAAPAPKPSAAKAHRFHLQMGSPIVDAPSIGPKTAERLEAVGVETVAQLVRADAESLAGKLAARHISAKTVRAWQAQAVLVCTVPELRGHDAQLAVAAGVQDAAALARARPSDLHTALCELAETSEGQRILRDSAPPDLEEVFGWIQSAAQARPLKAA